MSAPPHIDARTAVGAESRTALVRMANVALMLTASWNEPSMLVPRPDGSRRRQYLVRLFVAAHHATWPLDQARSIALYDGSNEPLTSDDFGGVHARHPDGVTLAWFVEDMPRYVLGGVGSESLKPSLPAAQDGDEPERERNRTEPRQD